MPKEQFHNKRALTPEQELDASPAPETWRGLPEESTFTAEQQQQILQERARALARETTQDKAHEETLRVVEFSLAHERYAVEALFVRGVQQTHHITPIPCTPSFVLGVINVHGRILSVIELRSFFDLSPITTARRETVVIFRTEKLEVGVLIDEVLGSSSLPVKSIKAVTPGRFSIRREYLRGIMDDQVLVLNVERILADKRMIIGGDEVEL